MYGIAWSNYAFGLYCLLIPISPPHRSTCTCCLVPCLVCPDWPWRRVTSQSQNTIPSHSLLVWLGGLFSGSLSFIGTLYSHRYNPQWPIYMMTVTFGMMFLTSSYITKDQWANSLERYLDNDTFQLKCFVFLNESEGNFIVDKNPHSYLAKIFKTDGFSWLDLKYRPYYSS